MEFEEETELLCEGQVEEDEADGKDKSDETFCQDICGHDGGEG